jgi:hypothetical protein
MELTTGLSQLDQFGTRVEQQILSSMDAFGDTATTRYDTALHSLDGSGWGPPHRQPVDSAATVAN